MALAICSRGVTAPPPIASSSSYLLPKLGQPRICFRGISPKTSKVRAFTRIVAEYDPYVHDLVERLEESLSSTSLPSLLQKLRDDSAQTLFSTRWPSRKDEPFRFTDTSFIKNSEIQPIIAPPQDSLSSLSASTETLLPTLCIVDGHLINSSSHLSELPDEVYVGGLSSINSEALMKRVSEYVCSSQGDLFFSLNGFCASDLIVVYVPDGCRVEKPLHLRYFSTEGSEKESKLLPISNPRVLVLLERGGEIGIIEEYVSGVEGKCYWTNSVLEAVIGERAKLSHSYIQTQALTATHIKWTSIQQESSSTYDLIEVSTGGKLSRHNVYVQQHGPDTVTELSTFHLSAGEQTQDLHSKLVLDHPRGFSRQVHKCIVAHPSGQAVFDGNIQVNRFAQQTDAGQLTRSLLLEPKATVNMKPNLQIIADDVKCSHGAAISDLEEDQLFYFQARGVDIDSARKALIFSFAAEVIERFPNPSIRKSVENHIRKFLDPCAP